MSKRELLAQQYRCVGSYVTRTEANVCAQHYRYRGYYTEVYFNGSYYELWVKKKNQ